MDQQYERATAIHEAGHAVIGRVLKQKCGPVTIEPDDDSSGHSICEDPWATIYNWWGGAPGEGTKPNGTQEACLRGRILAFMAGAEAELEFLGEYGGGDGDDRYQVALMLQQLPIPGQREEGDGSWERYEARLRCRCRGLVSRHRATIERVAEHLILCRSLCAGQIIYAMREAIPSDGKPA